MEATANIQGTIRLRSQIKMRKRKNEPAHYRKIRFQSKWDRKFMCIFKKDNYHLFVSYCGNDRFQSFYYNDIRTYRCHHYDLLSFPHKMS